MTAPVRGFAVATPYETVDEVIAHYAPLASDDTLFVELIEERARGRECAFAVLLANRLPVLAGICSVSEVFRDANNAYGRRGMLLHIRRLGVTSEHVFAAMAEARVAASPRRFPRGSTAPPEDDGIPIHVDAPSDGIPPDVDVDPSAPTLVRG